MPQHFSPYEADRPLMMRCSCGRDHTAAEHQAEDAVQQLKARSLAADFEAYSREFVEASLVKALFPHDAVRRRFLRAVGTVGRELGVVEGGYRVLANHGQAANQEVPHLHVHLFAGAPLGPMLKRVAA